MYTIAVQVRLAAVLSACALVACGGRATNAGVASRVGTGGSGGASNDASASSGTGGVAGGSAGTSGAGGDAGSGGHAAMSCAGAAPAFVVLGFSSDMAGSTSATIAKVLPDSLQLEDPDGGALEFTWRGADLTSYFKSGEVAAIGVQDGWSYVSGESSFAAARSITPIVYTIPTIPIVHGPDLAYDFGCELPDPCGLGSAMLSIRATGSSGNTWPDAITLFSGNTGQIDGWQIDHVNSFELPCGQLTPGSGSVITVLEPSAADAGI